MTEVKKKSGKRKNALGKFPFSFAVVAVSLTADGFCNGSTFISLIVYLERAELLFASFRTSGRSFSLFFLSRPYAQKQKKGKFIFRKN